MAKHIIGQNTLDRRMQKTKKYLADALRDLILEKGYDAITIQDIIDRADVGRSTFYAHYESKDQLLIGNINFQDALINTPTGNDEAYPMGINISYLFNHTKEHISLIAAMLGTRSIDIVSNHFAEVCKGKIIEYYKKRMPKSKAGQKLLYYKADAAGGAITRMLFKWLEDGASFPADDMINAATHILHAIMSDIKE